MPDDERLTAALAEIRERGYQRDQNGAAAFRQSDDAARDIPRLLAALEKALKLAAGWEDKAGECRAFAARKRERGNAIPAWISEASADAREDCVQALREAITRELTGEGGNAG